jgi:hypothetical protein
VPWSIGTPRDAVNQANPHLEVNASRNRVRGVLARASLMRARNAGTCNGTSNHEK